MLAPSGPSTSTLTRALLTSAAIATAALACTPVSTAPTSKAPAARRGTLTVGVPSARLVDGGADLPPPALTESFGLDDVDLALVTAEVKRHAGALEQCYERRLLASPGLAGTIAIHWVIPPGGVVSEQCITTDAVGDPALVACVNELVQGAAFPTTFREAVDVTFPFEFAPTTGATLASRR